MISSPCHLWILFKENKKASMHILGILNSPSGGYKAYFIICREKF